jgi:HNH endonuclease/NUMOD4 motif
MVEWRSAESAPHYQASDQGDIRSLDRIDLLGRFHRGRVLHPTPNAKSGYLMVTICEDGVRTKRYVHDIVAETFHGTRPPGLEVRHLNGHRSDCRASNLEWGSRTENLYDAVAHGTHHFSSRSRCINGHSYSPANTRFFPSRPRVRVCLTCRAEHQHTSRQRRRMAA